MLGVVDIKTHSLHNVMPSLTLLWHHSTSLAHDSGKVNAVSQCRHTAIVLLAQAGLEEGQYSRAAPSGPGTQALATLMRQVL